MALTGIATAAASVVTVAALEVVRSQRRRIEDLEDTVGDLQQTAQQFEGMSKMMSTKRKDTHEATKGHLNRLDDYHSAKEQKIAALQEQLEDMLTTVNVLNDKAAHFENAPKMFSLKRKESELATQHQLKALEGRETTKTKNFEKLQMNTRCLVEQLESFALRVTTLEVAQRRARRHARRQARLARLCSICSWPRPSPAQP